MDLDRMTRWYGGQEGGHTGFSSRLPSPVATARLYAIWSAADSPPPASTIAV
jgi:hypothetical protein